MSKQEVLKRRVILPAATLLSNCSWLLSLLLHTSFPYIFYIFCSSIVERVSLNKTIVSQTNTAFRMLKRFLKNFPSFVFVDVFLWMCFVDVLPVHVIYSPHQQALFHLLDFPHIFPSITPHCPNIYSTFVPTTVCSEQK